MKEQLAELLPDDLVMTDAIGSTEIGHERHPRRAEGRRAEGGHHDGAWRRPTRSCSTTTSNPLEPGTGIVGRLARGGNIPLGYYNDPEKTAATFVTDAQGRRWSIPGDFALLEADGRITLLGRGSVSINSGGEKIYPEEVEGALKSHPDVFDVLVVGVPDERWGERVTALLQPRDRTRRRRSRSSQAHCRGRIAGYKMPRELLLVDEVPRLPNGKPDYRRAKDQATRWRPKTDRRITATTRWQRVDDAVHGESPSCVAYRVGRSRVRSSRSTTRPGTSQADRLPTDACQRW